MKLVFQWNKYKENGKREKIKNKNRKIIENKCIIALINRVNRSLI